MPRPIAQRMFEAPAHGTGPAAAALVAIALAGLVVGASALAQTGTQPATVGQQPAASGTAAAPQPPKTASPAAPAKSVTSATPAPRSLPNRFAGRAGVYYKVVWGVDSLSVKWTESGEVIRFSWRVLDPEKAKVLNDKKAEPSLIDPRAGVSLVVPQMEKIGALRQSSRPEVGKAYWMAFSNKGLLVKRGDRVNVVIGPFRAENLVVD